MPDEPSALGTPQPPTPPSGQATVGAKLKVPGIESLNDNLAQSVKLLGELRQELQNLNNAQVTVFSKLADQLARMNKEGGSPSTKTGIYGLLGALAGAKTGTANPTLRQTATAMFPSVFTPENAKRYQSQPLAAGVTPAQGALVGSVSGSGAAPPPPPSGSTPVTYFSQGGSAHNSQMSALMASVGDKSFTDLATMNFSSGNAVGMLAEGLAQLFMKPLQFAFNRIEENRDAAMSMAKYLGPTSNRLGMGGQNRIEELIQTLSTTTPVRGSLADILVSLNDATKLGFTLDDDTRSGGFFTAIRQLQMMDPNTSAPSLVKELGGFMGNAQATQRSVLLTGGAFSFQTAGGGTKSLQEWAEGLLKFFQNQRPGRDRGKPFTKQQLEVQRFPGSNIDAWFQMNQVPEYLKDAFWQYAMTRVGTSDSMVRFDSMFASPDGEEDGLNNPAFERLRGLTTKAKRDFVLAASQNPLVEGSMFRSYTTRERTDEAFQKLLSNTVDPTLGAMAGPLGKIMDKIPSPLAEMLFKLVTGAGPPVIGAIAGGAFDLLWPFAEGGRVPGPNVNRDVVPSILTPGEYVIKKDVVDKFGVDFFNYLNAGQVKLFNTGGEVEEEGWTDKLTKLGITGINMGLDYINPGNNVTIEGGATTEDAVNAVPGLETLIKVGEKILSLLDKAGSLFSAGAQLVQGNFSGVMDFFGGLLNPTNLVEKLIGITGLPSALNPFSKQDKSDKEGFQRFDPATFNMGGPGLVGTAFREAEQALKGYGSGAAGQLAGGVNAAAQYAASIAANPSGTSSLTDAPRALDGLLTTAVAAYSAGFRGEKLRTAIAIAGAESSFNPRAHNPVGPDNSYGLWQINMLGAMGPERRKRYGIANNEALFDPVMNAKAAWKESGGGNNWRPWTTYTEATYKKYLDEADRALAEFTRGGVQWNAQGGLVTGPRVIGNQGMGEVREALIPLDNASRLKELTERYVLPAYQQAGGTQGGVTVMAPITVSISGRPTDGDVRQLGTTLGESFSKTVNDRLMRNG